MHFLCHHLKTARWTGQRREQIRDKYDDFFAMLKCNNSDLEVFKDRYGRDLPAATEAPTLRLQFTDCTTRVYELAYRGLECQRWRDLYFGNQASILNMAKQTLRSSEYQMHWLPKLINQDIKTGALPISAHIAVIGDKLRLLQHLDGRRDENEIAEVTRDLLNAAKLNGIARQTLIESPETQIVLDPHEAILHLNDMDTRWIAKFDINISSPMPAPPVDVADVVLHHCMNRDAKPLGLYVNEDSSICSIM